MISNLPFITIRSVNYLLISLTLYLGMDTSYNQDPPNIVYILCDDHRWDAMGFMDHPFIETPHMDRLAREGVYFKNAFVTTSLCSPSRASILTGLYAHNHGVVNNYNPVDTQLTFFPQILQENGYETAFIGKWHMGDVDEPQRGFDHWVAFRGQGTYYPDGHGTTRVVPQTRYDGFNINGQKRALQKGYITDEITDYAIEWLENRKAMDKPFFLYISHKAVHSDFVPRDQDRNKYQSETWSPPRTYPNTDENYKGKPRWLVDQRNSRHGVDYGYNLDDFEVSTYYKRYCEALTAVDDNLGRTLTYLAQEGLLDNTLLVYMGDNGFQFGEHGLIDKRTAYEASIRVPLLMHYPDQLSAGTTIDAVVANIDIAPTLLEAAQVGVRPTNMDGKSFWPVAKGLSTNWSNALLYEYYWEWNYPQTPTIFAIRDERYKFIRYHGLWDTDELYDVVADPLEQHNLIHDASFASTASEMKASLFKMMSESGGMQMHLLPDRGQQFYHRHKDRSTAGKFPPWYFDKPKPVTK